MSSQQRTETSCHQSTAISPTASAPPVEGDGANGIERMMQRYSSDVPAHSSIDSTELSSDAGFPRPNCFGNSSNKGSSVRKERTGSVYGLLDPTTGFIRYIGATSRSLPDRLANHLSMSRKRRSRLYVWMSELIAQGLRPQIILLQTVDVTSLEMAEKRHIIAYPDLLNATWNPGAAPGLRRGPKPGTGGRPRKLSPDVAAKHGGSPMVFFRLDPEIHTWLIGQGGPLFAKKLVLDAYEAERSGSPDS